MLFPFFQCLRSQLGPLLSDTNQNSSKESCWAEEASALSTGTRANIFISYYATKGYRSYSRNSSARFSTSVFFHLRNRYPPWTLMHIPYVFKLVSIKTWTTP
jgi:hypothetical protein